VINQFLTYSSKIKNDYGGQENCDAHAFFSPKLMLEYKDIVREPIHPYSTYHSEFSFHEILISHIFTRNIPAVLRIEDRSSMAFGIESRVPFLDHNFMEYVFSHKDIEFMRGGENKSMLRRAMSGIVPQMVLDRKSKSNRPGSHAYLMYKVFRDKMLTHLSEYGNSINFELFANPAELLNHYLDDVKNNYLPRSEFWFRLYVYMRWKEIHVV
jgi:asparagine synthetase B (glutamine-hydrolysing)